MRVYVCMLYARVEVQTYECIVRIVMHELCVIYKCNNIRA